MSQVSALQSLDLILEDVSAEINLAINSLDQYSRKIQKNDNLDSHNSNNKKTDKGNKDSQANKTQILEKCLAHLNKLKGVFTILEMHGALRLITEVMMIIKSLSKYEDSFQLRLLEVISTGLARLMRYNEHVNQKSYDLPQLLLPTINFLRKSVGATQLGESVFFNCHFNKPRANKTVVLITSDESAAQSRHFRQMYQIGLIEVMRNTNLFGGLRMMKKALSKLDDECIRPNSPNLWWIAQGMLDGFIEKKLILTKSRFKIFSRLDRQIRQIENKLEGSIDENKLEINLLTKEVLYLAWIGSAETQTVKKLLEHFDLKKPEFNDSLLKTESVDFRGPSDQDYQSVSEALTEEINNIEKNINHYLKIPDSELNLEEISNQMINLKGLLSVLKVDDQIVRLNVALDIIDKAQASKEKLSEKNANILIIVIESLKNAVDQYELVKYSSNSPLRRKKLSKNQQDISENTYTAIKKIIHQFTEFTVQKRKQSLLKGIGDLLTEVREGFSKLKIVDALPTIDGCIIFINFHLSKNPHTTSQNAINLFADIIGSFEFYLETLKHTAKPSPRIIEFAENSLLELNRISKSKENQVDH